jgi:cellulose synthase/poly-beta-1,6-N-acetylglucosamine synthase-like glycosyltransferase
MHYWSTSIALTYIGGHYLVKLAQYYFSWKKTIQTSNLSHVIHPVTVLIPFRNEKPNLASILKNLAAQKQVKAEFIFIDDHSTDGGAQLVQQMSSRDARFKLIFNQEGEQGKKAAIANGIRNASTEWIVTTDADIQLNDLWLFSLGTFMHEGTDMVCAPVIIDSNGYFSKFQSLEMCVLNTLTGASIHQGRPLMCSGANLAFRKETWLSLPEHAQDNSSLSGDDMFLLQRMIESEKKIAYAHLQDCAVHTQAATWSQFWRQRVRWAGKTKLVNNKVATQLGTLIVVNNLMMIWCFLNTFLRPQALELYIGFCLLKSTADLLVLFPSLRRFGKLHDLIGLPVLIAFYPFYTMGIGLLSLWWRPKWKGRDLSLTSK